MFEGGGGGLFTNQDPTLLLLYKQTVEHWHRSLSVLSSSCVPRAASSSMRAQTAAYKNHCGVSTKCGLICNIFQHVTPPLIPQRHTWHSVTCITQCITCGVSTCNIFHTWRRVSHWRSDTLLASPSLLEARCLDQTHPPRMEIPLARSRTGLEWFSFLQTRKGLKDGDILNHYCGPVSLVPPLLSDIMMNQHEST